MKLRNYLFEFEDLAWLPDTIRESLTDYLRYLVTKVDFYFSIEISVRASGISLSHPIIGLKFREDVETIGEAEPPTQAMGKFLTLLRVCISFPFSGVSAY
jgi:hypothetical protein